MHLSATSLHLDYQRAETLGDEITELYGYITAASYELLVRIAEFDEKKLWGQGGLCSCAHWLNWKCGIGMNAGREKVRVARALGGLPKISQAFRRGEISYSKVRAITRVAHAGNEDYLLKIARHGTAHHVETLVRGYRRAVRLNDPAIAERQHCAREFSYRWDEDGSLMFNGRLPAEVGALLMKALESAVDASRKDEDVTAETREPIAAKRADALAAMAETWLANGPAISSAADRYQVLLHVTAETPAESHLQDGPHVTAETSKRTCCDASISRLISDDKGEPISIGRKSRVIPPPMRRALRARDRGCRFPGCTHRYFIDGHHIKHWSDGGETSLDNLVQLCRQHHRLVHEGGFGCERNKAGSIVFRTPSGQVIDDTGITPRCRGNVVADLKRRLEDRHIHAQTCVTRWRGERMDRHLAVGLLWDMERDRLSGSGAQYDVPGPDVTAETSAGRYNAESGRPSEFCTSGCI